MSEPASQPGAPADGAQNIPPASEKSVAREMEKKVPAKVTSALATPDAILLRLNKYETDRRETTSPNIQIDCSLLPAA